MELLKLAFLHMPIITFFTDIPDDFVRFINGRKIMPQHIYSYILVAGASVLFTIMVSIMTFWLGWNNMDKINPKYLPYKIL